MGLFEDFAATSLNPGVAGLFCTPATFTPPNGDPVPEVSVNISRDVILQPDAHDSTLTETGTMIEAFVSEIGTGDPLNDSTFTVDSGEYAGVYTVARVLENNGNTVLVQVI